MEHDALAPGSAAPADTPNGLSSRHHQMFFRLDGAEIRRVRRLGTVHSFQAGEFLMSTRKVARDIVFILSGCVAVIQRDEMGNAAPIVELGGLSTAVYAASEGLRVVMLDVRSYGGQAGHSARIKNYLGFPIGISGAALAGRAVVQAEKFGVELLIPCEVRSMDCARQNDELRLRLADGRRLRARTVVIASGARYRRPAVPRRADFEGRGIWYWASMLEARSCAKSEVAVVGGGNSSGQAAVFLSQHASKVHLFVRGSGLASSTSQYLIDRIDATSNIDLRPDPEITGVHGDVSVGLSAVTWRNRRTDVEDTKALCKRRSFHWYRP